MVVLYLKDGEIKLSLQLGSGQLKTGVSKVIFNDSMWHKVDISRRAEKVSAHDNPPKSDDYVQDP